MIDKLTFIEDHTEFCRAGAFLAIGASAGAGIMFLLDPERGARRRALIRDKTHSVVHDAQQAVVRKGEDLAHRTSGFVAEARGRLIHKKVPDDKLAARVRTELGRLVSKPRTVEVIVNDGVVTLRGWAAPNEVPKLLQGVEHVVGVQRVESQMAGI